MKIEEPFETGDSAVPPDLTEGLRFLLFRYGRTPSPLIAERIARCLDSILSDRRMQISLEDRCVYRQMRTFWRLIATQG